MEQGGFGAMQPAQDRLAGRLDDLDQVNRLIALQQRALQPPVAAVSAERAVVFAASLRAKRQDNWRASEGEDAYWHVTVRQ